MCNFSNLRDEEEEARDTCCDCSELCIYCCHCQCFICCKDEDWRQKRDALRRRELGLEPRKNGGDDDDDEQHDLDAASSTHKDKSGDVGQMLSDEEDEHDDPSSSFNRNTNGSKHRKSGNNLISPSSTDISPGKSPRRAPSLKQLKGNNENNNSSSSKPIAPSGRVLTKKLVKKIVNANTAVSEMKEKSRNNHHSLSSSSSHHHLSNSNSLSSSSKLNASSSSVLKRGTSNKSLKTPTSTLKNKTSSFSKSAPKVVEMGGGGGNEEGESSSATPIRGKNPLSGMTP